MPCCCLHMRYLSQRVLTTDALRSLCRHPGCQVDSLSASHNGATTRSLATAAHNAVDPFGASLSHACQTCRPSHAAAVFIPMSRWVHYARNCPPHPHPTASDPDSPFLARAPCGRLSACTAAAPSRRHGPGHCQPARRRRQYCLASPAQWRLWHKGSDALRPSVGAGVCLSKACARLAAVRRRNLPGSLTDSMKRCVLHQHQDQCSLQRGPSS